MNIWKEIKELRQDLNELPITYGLKEKYFDVFFFNERFKDVNVCDRIKTLENKMDLIFKYLDVQVKNEPEKTRLVKNRRVK